MEQKTGLTAQQRLWLKAYFDIENDLGYDSFCNQTRAALFAYYPDFHIGKEIKDFTDEEKSQYNSARTIGWENLTKLDIPIEKLLDEAGMSDAFLMGQLRNNMKATKLYGKNAIEHPDYASRNRATELTLRVKQKLIERHDITTKGDKITGLTNREISNDIHGIIEDDEPIKPTNDATAEAQPGSEQPTAEPTTEPTNDVPSGTGTEPRVPDNGEPSATVPIQNDPGEDGSNQEANSGEVQEEGSTV